MKINLWCFALALALAAPYTRAAPAALKPAFTEAQLKLREAVEESREAHRRRERLRKDLRYVAEELDRDVLFEERGKGLAAYSRFGRRRLGNLRGSGNLDPRLGPVLARLEDLYRELPSRQYAETYSASLMRAISETLRWAAENGANEDETVDSSSEILKTLERALALPDSVPAEGNEVSARGFFPEDLSPASFKRLDPIRAFLVKHRLRRPPFYVKTTVEDLLADRHNVQIGVEIEGAVTHVDDCWFDQDYCFNVGNLHVEIPPSWWLFHRDITRPKEGQRVRLKGWSYLDVFHKSELEYDPKHPTLGINRPTIWEIHPLQDVEILP